MTDIQTQILLVRTWTALRIARARSRSRQHESDLGASIVETVIIIGLFVAAAILIVGLLVTKAKQAAYNVKIQ